MLSTLPSGLAIDRYSIRHLLLVSVLLLSSASVLMPLSAELIGPYGAMALRFVMGVGEGVMIPGINGMLTGWIPSHEKSTAASLFTSGNQLAGIIGNPVAAEFCASKLRWPAVFYSSGILGFFWCIVWQFTVNNSPANSKWISDHEVTYLQHHLPEKQTKRQKKVIPWRSMMRSAPLIVVFYSSIICNMMIAMILVYIPVYFKDVLMLEVKQNGFYTALPHTFNLISKLVWGPLMDYLKQKKLLTATQTVKLSQVTCDVQAWNSPVEQRIDPVDADNKPLVLYKEKTAAPTL
ncbi:unnamed protein product [Strongylus vulgaris]|uniref:Major facilitator superfamily (MFS) profile domain-containing protein n=1 Tax=Strongylus vulgaris TaxID=40348 RepID=A0A3P7L692_STRVU|nr:unnamed protein product [Strongylus vulgaris]